MSAFHLLSVEFSTRGGFDSLLVYSFLLAFLLISFAATPLLLMHVHLAIVPLIIMRDSRDSLALAWWLYFVSRLHRSVAGTARVHQSHYH